MRSVVVVVAVVVAVAAVAACEQAATVLNPHRVPPRAFNDGGEGERPVNHAPTSDPRGNVSCADIVGDLNGGDRVLATEDDDVASIAVAGAYVYWSSGSHLDVTQPGHVVRVRKTGGAAEVVADVGRNPGHFAADDGGRLIFADYLEGGAVSVLDASEEPPALTTLVDGRSSPLFVALTDDRAYWSDNSGGQIVSANANDGSDVTTLFGGPDSISWITRDDAFLYWTGLDFDDNGRGVVRRLPLGGGDADILVRANNTSLGLLEVTERFFFVSDDFGRLLRLDRNAPDGDLTIFGESVYRMTHDATRVFWSSLDGNIRARSFAGDDDEVVLASGQATPYSIAVDDCAVYWVNLDDLTIRIASK